MDRTREEGRYVYVPTPMGEMVFPKQAYKALKTAAENPGLSNKALAEKMQVKRGYYTNKLSEVYAILLLERSQSDQRTAAIDWYNRYARPHAEDSDPVASVIKPHTLLTEPLTEPAVHPQTDGSYNDHQTTYKAVLITLYLAFVIIVFGGIQIVKTRDGILNDYTNLYNFVPLVGGILAIVRVRQASKQYSLSPTLVNGVIATSIGLIIWALGSFVWLFYNVILGERTPYPSLADLGYFLGICSLIIGTRQVFGVSLRSRVRRVVLTILAMITFIAGLLTIALSLRAWQLLPEDPAKLFFDVFYPAADLYIIIMLLIYISQDDFVKVPITMRQPVYTFFLGMVLLFAGDFIFSVTTTLPETSYWSFYNGNMSDLAFLSAFFMTATALLSLPYRDLEV